MTNKIAQIKLFIQKHKTLFIMLAVLKLLLKVGIVLFFVAKANGAVAQNANKLLREGNKLYKKEKYNNATESYAKALQLAHTDVRAYFNQGDALYRLNELDKSKEQFTAVTKASKNTDITARAHYNIGNIHYKQEKWEESAKAYKESLKLNPKDEDAKYNLMMALAKIKKEKNNNKDNKNNKDDKNKEDKNDNKDKDKQQNQQQNKNDKQQQSQDKQQDQNKQQQQQQGQISKEQAEKLLDAIGAEEGKVQQKLGKEKGKPQKGKIQKDW